MPAVAVRHERKRQEKRLKRPSQLYLGGQWMPPPQGSPPTPSPHGHNSHLEPLPELYLCGKVISRHMSQWPTVVVTILSISIRIVGVLRDSTNVRFLRPVQLWTVNISIMNSKLSEYLKKYWSYYLDSMVNTVKKSVYITYLYFFNKIKEKFIIHV